MLLSRAKNVAKFRKWVCSVVLPSIRKTGSYGITQPQASLPNFLDPAESAMAWAEQYRAKQLAESEATQARLLLEAQAPKVEAYERFMDSDGLLSMNDTAKILGTGRNTLFEELRSAGVFTGTSPKQCYVSQGYFVVKATTNANWSGAVTRVTPRGMEWLARGKWKVPNKKEDRSPLSQSIY
jgi:phage antirepressor YoqD-like protein